MWILRVGFWKEVVRSPPEDSTSGCQGTKTAEATQDCEEIVQVRKRGIVKTCSTCKREKTLWLFSKNSCTKDGLRSRCKQCDSTRRAEDYLPRIKNRTLLRKYNITKDRYDEIVKDQLGNCALCFEGLESGGRGSRSPVIDHDHGSGVIRGVLHSDCNSGIGFLSDSLKKLRQAVEYMKRYEGDE